MTEETTTKKGIIAEFKEFINRGSVMDLAVGVVVGGAFTSIVNSLVNDIIMPLIGLVLGGIDFSGLSITVGEAKVTYGNFIQNVLNFLIVAFCIFLMVKTMNKMRENSEKTAALLAARTAVIKEKAEKRAESLKEELKLKSQKSK